MSQAFQNLDDWLVYIAQSHPSEIELGLDRVKSVYQKMSFAAMPSKVVVVAGTNGKGSTVALSSAGLSALGYRCGTYTSPHIARYNERVQISNSEVSDQSLIQAFQYVDQIRGDVPLTYFEFGTLAAFYILFNAKLDVALLEIGLGGRLDAVNIVDADVSIITSVDIDHVDWLGNDIQKIGKEKAGILRKNGVFLAGEELPASVFEYSASLGCPELRCHEAFFRDDEVFGVSSLNGEIERFPIFPNLKLPDNNVLLSLQLIYLLGDGKFDSDLVSRGMEMARLSGRIELSDQYPNLYFDVGHNPHAARFLSTFLKEEKAKGKRIEVVYSALGDKDIEGVIKELADDVDHWCIAPLGIERATSLDELESLVRLFSESVDCFESIGQALDSCLPKKGGQSTANTIGNTKLVLVFGSFFTVEAAKKYLDDHE
jgi:dihydrofolate synthase/folylpolyglutamate synthase